MPSIWSSGATTAAVAVDVLGFAQDRPIWGTRVGDNTNGLAHYIGYAGNSRVKPHVPVMAMAGSTLPRGTKPARVWI